MRVLSLAAAAAAALRVGTGGSSSASPPTQGMPRRPCRAEPSPAPGSPLPLPLPPPPPPPPPPALPLPPRALPQQQQQLTMSREHRPTCSSTCSSSRGWDRPAGVTAPPRLPRQAPLTPSHQACQAGPKRGGSAALPVLLPAMPLLAVLLLLLLLLLLPLPHSPSLVCSSTPPASVTSCSHSAHSTLAARRCQVPVYKASLVDS